MNESLAPGAVVWYRNGNTTAGYVCADVIETYTDVYGEEMVRLVDQVSRREYVASLDYLTHRPEFEVTSGT